MSAHDRIEDASWPTHTTERDYLTGLAAQVAALVVSRLKDEGVLHDDRPLLSVPDAARRLGVSERVMGDMIRGFKDPKTGEQQPPVLASVLVGKGGQKGVKVEPAEIDRYLERQRRLAWSREDGR